MSTISNANVLATKATGARAKKESGNTPDSSARVANTPNAKTLASIAEAEAGDVIKFDTVDDMEAYFTNARD